MCCFTREVEKVENTRIFARRNNKYQYLVYQMDVKTPTDNVMVLPIPCKNKEEDSLRFIDLSDCEDFFKNMKRSFADIRFSKSLGIDEPLSRSLSRTLTIHEVGDFEASFVPKKSDFDRLDDLFKFKEGTFDKIKEYDDYSFAVFKFKKAYKTLKFHPMAFVFESFLDNQIFFPTVHIHDGEIHSEEHFDHSLYFQSDCHKDDLSLSFGKFRIDESFYDLGQYMGESYKIKEIINQHSKGYRIAINGNSKNQDLIVKMKNDARKFDSEESVV